ncbi:MAG: hypothetical protein HYX89_00045 [Chloroflexi bacterium]|nr:hypothetical protein [Chloroflexota bacterium]
MERGEIVEDIKRVASQLGKKTVTFSEYQQHGRAHITSVLRRFGRWNNAVEAAGLEPIPRGATGGWNKITDEELYDEFTRVYESLGKVPTKYEFTGASRFTTDPYQRRFGGWRKAVAYYLGSEAVSILHLRQENAEAVLSDQTKREQAHFVAEIAASKTRRVFGAPLNFRELRHEPVNEQGVVLLFGMIARELGFLVDAVGTGFPDCRAKRRDRRGYYIEVDIEFEFRSSNFREHGHDPEKCDLVVCWEDDWSECPVEVLELKSAIRQLPNVQT